MLSSLSKYLQNETVRYEVLAFFQLFIHLLMAANLRLCPIKWIGWTMDPFSMCYSVACLCPAQF